MRLNRKDTTMFILPATILYSIFVLLPLILGLYFSFTDINGMSKTINFVGFDNFKRVFMDENFSTSLKNTFIFTLLFSIFSNLLAIIIALFLELEFSKLYKNVVRVLFYLPAVLTPVIVGFMWYYIYKVGLPGIFEMLGLKSLSKVQFIGTDYALYSTIFVTIWLQAGTAMIIYIAGLSNIDNNLYEAAKIDGAGQISIFRHISIPMIIPAFLINIVLTIISGFKQFDQIFTMTKGGPGNRTQVISLLIYSKAFSAGDLAYASATAFILFIIVCGISLFIINYFKGQEAKKLD